MPIYLVKLHKYGKKYLAIPSSFIKSMIKKFGFFRLRIRGKEIIKPITGDKRIIFYPEDLKKLGLKRRKQTVRINVRKDIEQGLRYIDYEKRFSEITRHSRFIRIEKLPRFASKPIYRAYLWDLVVVPFVKNSYKWYLRHKDIYPFHFIQFYFTAQDERTKEEYTYSYTTSTFVKETNITEIINEVYAIFVEGFSKETSYINVWLRSMNYYALAMGPVIVRERQ